MLRRRSLSEVCPGCPMLVELLRLRRISVPSTGVASSLASLRRARRAPDMAETSAHAPTGWRAPTLGVIATRHYGPPVCEPSSDATGGPEQSRRDQPICRLIPCWNAQPACYLCCAHAAPSANAPVSGGSFCARRYLLSASRIAASPSWRQLT